MSSSAWVAELGMGLRSPGAQKQGFKRFQGFSKQNVKVLKLIC